MFILLLSHGVFRPVFRSIQCFIYLLHIFVALPATQVSCGRTFSKLKIITNCLHIAQSLQYIWKHSCSCHVNQTFSKICPITKLLKPYGREKQTVVKVLKYCLIYMLSKLLPNKNMYYKILPLLFWLQKHGMGQFFLKPICP